MKDVNETLLKFDGFDAWGWEAEFQRTLAVEKPDADGPVVARMRLDLLRSFVDFVREVVDMEFRLGLLVRVERVTPKRIIGSADFGNDRQGVLAGVEDSIFWSRRRLPRPCKTGPVLDRLLACTEIVRSPDRLDSELGDLKRECVARFRNDGTISDAIKHAEPDGANAYFRYIFPEPTGFAPK